MLSAGVMKPSCPVLVVEDDESFRKPLIVALDEMHFTVTSASNGVEAIEMLEGRAFQVIILDLNLPERTGYEVLEHIRANREKITARIIVVSGVGPQARQDADLAIAEEVLLKPVDFHYVAQRAIKYCDPVTV